MSMMAVGAADYSKAIDGLSLSQAKLLLNMQGVDAEQQKSLLLQAGLISSSEKMTASHVAQALSDTTLKNTEQERVLIKAGLMNAQTKELILENNCTEAKLREVLANTTLDATEKDAIVTRILGANANGGYAISFDVLTASIWANIKALVAWLTTNPVGWCILAAGAIFGLVKVIDLATTSTSEYEEKLDNLKSEYSEITSQIESVNSELETTRQRIEELEGKDSLTFTEKEEYDNLVRENNELERKLHLLKLEEKQKNKETNKTFVDTMESDVNKNDERVFTGNLDSHDNAETEYITEEELVQRKFKELAELRTKLKNATTDYQKETFQNQITNIEKYLKDKNVEFSNRIDGINYIKEPSNEDDKAVNKWLDYVNDFQDKLAITTSDGVDNATAKNDAFNRIVDSWQFDDTVQGLQDLGKEGKVTAEMLNNPKYDEFINKLVFLGVIDSADNLEDVALAFNSVSTSAENATDSARQYANETAISFLDKFNSSDFAETKEKLLDLAKSGEINTKVLESTEEYNELLKETKTKAKDAVKYITDMLDVQEKMAAFQKGTSSIKNAYQEFKDKKFVTAETLESLPDSFKTLKGFDLFSQIVGDPTSGKKKIKDAFDDIVTEYAKYQGTLKGVTEETKESAIANLTDAGVTNARSVVESYIKHSNEMETQLDELQEKTNKFNKEEFNSFIDYLNGKGTASSELMSKIGNNNAEMINELSDQYKNDLSNWLELCNKKKEAYNKLVNALKDAQGKDTEEKYSNAVGNLSGIKKGQSAYDYVTSVAGAYQRYKKADKDAKEAYEQFKLNTIDLDFDLDFDGTDTGKNSSDKDKKTKSLFDWIEVKLDRINSKAEKFRKTMDLALSYNTKRKQGLNALTQMEKEYETNEKGAKRYQKQADKYTTKNGRYIKGTSGIKVSDVENGKIDITSLTDKQQKAVENYKTWYDKSQNMKQANLELIETMRDMAESIYNLPIDKAEEKIEDYTDTAELASKRIENAKNATEKRSLRNAILQSSKDTLNIRNNAKSETESNYNKLIDKKGNIKGTKIKATGEEIDVIDKKTGKVKYSGKQLEAIQKYNAALEAQKNALKEAELAQEDYVTAIRENVINTMQDIIDDFDNKIQVNDAIISVHSSYKDMKETQGFMAKSDDWNGVIAGSLNDVNLKYQEWQKVKAEWDAKDKTALTDSEISEWSAKILDFESQYYEAEKTKADYIKQRNEQEIQNLNDQLELLDSISSEYEALLSLRDAQGAEFRTADEIMTQLNNKDNELYNLERQKTSAQNLYNDAISRGADADIVEYGKKLNDINAQIFQKKAEQEELVNSLYDEQKYRINKMKEALQKANEEQDKRLQLEKAQYNLLKAQNQRTQKVFNGKEFVYQADEDAIKSAQEELDKLEFDSLIDALDYLADTIIEQAKKENNLYDENGNRIKTNWDAMSEAGRFSEVSNNLTDPVLTEKGYDVDKLISAETLESMWKNAENNFNNLIYKMPDYSKLSELVSKPTEQKLTISIGDINLSNVNNAEDLARDIVNRLPNTVSQYIRK